MSGSGPGTSFLHVAFYLPADWFTLVHMVVSGSKCSKRGQSPSVRKCSPNLSMDPVGCYLHLHLRMQKQTEPILGEAATEKG